MALTHLRGQLLQQGDSRHRTASLATTCAHLAWLVVQLQLLQLGLRALGRSRCLADGSGCRRSRLPPAHPAENALPVAVSGYGKGPTGCNRAPPVAANTRAAAAAAGGCRCQCRAREQPRSALVRLPYTARRWRCAAAPWLPVFERAWGGWSGGRPQSPFGVRNSIHGLIAVARSL